jgi:hypothetical protein
MADDVLDWKEATLSRVPWLPNCPECGDTIKASAVTVDEIYCDRCDEVFDR